MSKSNSLDKFLAKKISEVKEHFGLDGELTQLVREQIIRVAQADLDLQRHEILCAQLQIGDPNFEYLKAEKNRAEKVHRLRLAALQRLIGRKPRPKLDCFSINSLFGLYEIPEKSGKWFYHWRYILCNPERYSFSPNLPKRGVKKIGREYFLTLEAAKTLEQVWDATVEEKFTTHAGEYAGCLSEQYCQLLAAAKQKAGRYEYLRPSAWRALFSPELRQPEMPKFADVLPPPADAVTIKGSRNRLDYLRRKQKAI